MAEIYTRYKNQIEKHLNDKNSPFEPIFEFIETKTGIKRTYVCIGFIIFTTLYLIFGYAAQLLCNIIGFLYPAYSSMKAIETPQKGDDTKWLTYWTVFALFSILEFPTDLLLSWFPLYWLVKCVFMIWLYLPIKLNGSVFLYENIIRPRFLKNEGTVDNLINKIAGKAKQTIDAAGNKLE